jgi:hypothetical protein
MNLVATVIVLAAGEVELDRSTQVFSLDLPSDAAGQYWVSSGEVTYCGRHYPFPIAVQIPEDDEPVHVTIRVAAQPDKVAALPDGRLVRSWGAPEA